MYTAKDFTHLLGLTGFSDTMLNNHFTLYSGYVDNTNKINDILKVEEAGPKRNELKRRLGWEWCGMRMHELYFGNMTKEVSAPSASLDTVFASFGGFENWKKDFAATGAMRGIGWVVLYKDGENYVNQWIAEHEAGHMVGSDALVVMDCWEHAYITDYGIKRADYINAFMGVIDWAVVESRLTK